MLGLNGLQRGQQVNAQPNITDDVLALITLVAARVVHDGADVTSAVPAGPAVFTLRKIGVCSLDALGVRHNRAV